MAQYRLGARIFRNRRTTFFGGHRAQIEIAAEFRELHLFYRRTLGYTSNQPIFDFHYVTQPRAMFNAWIKKFNYRVDTGVIPSLTQLNRGLRK